MLSLMDLTHPILMMCTDMNIGLASYVYIQNVGNRCLQSFCVIEEKRFGSLIDYTSTKRG